jgi:hypothetical protein
MTSNKSGRVLVAATLAAALFLAVPAQANDGRWAPQGALERLAAWFVETWLSGEPAGGTDDSQAPTPHTTDGEGDPEGCRGEYTACIDPNG